MNVLLTAGGFIGARLARRLCDAGHQVTVTGRSQLDLSQSIDRDEWLARLRGVEVLVNTAGLFRDTPRGVLEAVHHHGPAALFKLAAEAGVRRIVQLSALGADPAAPQPFLASKGRGDASLAKLALEWHIVRPSLVFGAQGASSRLLLALARWPLLLLPAGGVQQIQPVHLDDVVEGLQRMVEGHGQAGEIIAAVGPQPMTLAEYLQTLRAARGRAPATVIAVSNRLAHAASAVAEHWPGSLLTRDALAMLNTGNCADPQPFTRLLGHTPRAAQSFMREG